MAVKGVTCDRANIIAQRLFNCGYIKAEHTAYVKDHVRIALDMEVEAGGPYLVSDAGRADGA